MIGKYRVRLVDAFKRLARPVGWVSIYAGILLSSVGLAYTCIGWVAHNRYFLLAEDTTSCWWGIAMLILAYVLMLSGWGLLRRRNVRGLYARKRVGTHLMLIGLILISIRAGVYIASRRVPLDYVRSIKSWEDVIEAKGLYEVTPDEARKMYESGFSGTDDQVFERMTHDLERETRSAVQQAYGGIELIGIVWLLVGLGLRYIADEPREEIDVLIATKRFLDAGNDPNGKCKTSVGVPIQGFALPVPFTARVSPLHEACSKGHQTVASLLIDSGADVDIVGPLDMTPLHIAAEADYPRIVNLLIESGADVNAQGFRGQYPLHLAAAAKDEFVLEILLAVGAEVNLKDNEGDTPLHWAAGCGNKAAAESLLDEGADINARNGAGKSPYDLAIEYEQTELAEILEKLTYEDTVDPDPETAS
jgi:hypothetical protein